MKLVIFGLAISSSWGNGHATLWRGLCREFIARGHQVTFFERDVPYYASHRDVHEISGGRLVLYPSWDQVRDDAAAELKEADAGLITSYCPDALAALDLLLESPAMRVFYDLDTPVTLAALTRGEDVSYIGPQGLSPFDLVLSFTGGRTLELLDSRLGAHNVQTLYGSVDPEIHRITPTDPAFQADLSYLGTYAADRQDALLRLFIEPARQRPDARFTLAGAMYPASFPWTDNIYFVRHLSPAQHAAFYSSSRFTLNITRRDMAELGFCPSGRLFEAAACGVPILTDTWPGLETFFEPEKEIVVVHTTRDVLRALDLSVAERSEIAARARSRVLAEHTAAHRAAELEAALTNNLQFAGEV